MTDPVLVTGCAGFIGFHTSLSLLKKGRRVVGIDNLNDYYDVNLKNARLDQLKSHPGFSISVTSLSDKDALVHLWDQNPDIRHIIHLAAQAGVRYSLVNPHAYIEANILGHLNILELCRARSGFQHLVYASSSSVYGRNKVMPFSVDERTDSPISLYAATKKSDELMTDSYAHLFGIPATGLRFFTVYGPWGRPDMAAFIFAKSILEGKPIQVFNNGHMRRDFTYIDDIVSGIVAVLEKPATNGGRGDVPPHQVYNLGCHRSENLMDFIAIIEQELGRKAIYDLAPLQDGDVAETYADIESSRRDFGFDPQTPIAVGLPKFIAWYRQYYKV